MATKQVRSALDVWSVDWMKVSDETGLACADLSRTVQADAQEADINVILDRFGITGSLPVSQRAPTFEDFSEVFDFRSAIEAIEMAQDAFMTLPGKVRARFGNDPQEFVAFCSDEKNLKEMRELGLAPPEKVADVPPVTPAKPA